MDLTKGQKRIVKYIYYLSNFTLVISIILIITLCFASIMLQDFNGAFLFKADIKHDYNFAELDNIKVMIGSIESECFLSPQNVLHKLILNFFMIVIIGGGQLWLIIEIRKIIKTFVLENPFVIQNIKSLKKISLIVLCVPFLLYLVSLFYLSIFNLVTRIEMNHLMVSPKPYFEFTDGIFYAAFIYLVALAFQKGFNLEKEQELTV